MLDRFYLGAIAPEKLEGEVTGLGVAEGDLDLSTVTLVELKINKPGMGTLEEDTWDADIDAASEFSLLFSHEFDVADLDRVGTYRIMVMMTAPDGVHRAGPMIFEGIYRG